MSDCDPVVKYELEMELEERDSTIYALQEKLTKLSDRVEELEETLQATLFHGLQPALAKKVRADPLHLVQDLMDEHGGSIEKWRLYACTDQRIARYASFLPAGTGSEELLQKALKEKLIHVDGRRKSPTYGKFIPGKRRLY